MNGRACMGQSGHWFDRLAFALGAMALGLPASVLLVQVAYLLFPAQPSAAVLRFETEAAQRPIPFENGYRLAGLLAPHGVDPLVFGRCRFPQAEQRAAAQQAGGSMAFPSREDIAARMDECLNGASPLALSPAIDQAIASPAWTQENWYSLGQETPDPVLLERAIAIWNQGGRGFGPDFWQPRPEAAPLLKLAQWRVAAAASQWQDGHADQALAMWSAVGQSALRSSGNDLVETMLSTNELTRLFLSLQTAIRSAEKLDTAHAARAMQIVSTAEAMPQALSASLLSEWQGMAMTFGSMPEDVGVPTGKDPAPKQTQAKALTRWLIGWVYDPVDSVNQITPHFEGMRSAVFATASGQTPAVVEPAHPCAVMGDAWHLCRPYERNPLGRYLVRENAPSYATHGTRIADLRNLAAAARLTIEARRQGLTGEALASFIARAPEGMRDVFTQQAFAYQPDTRTLGIVLRGKSPVLGEPGRYALGL